jgi:hypothetical protein
LSVLSVALGACKRDRDAALEKRINGTPRAGPEFATRETPDAILAASIVSRLRAMGLYDLDVTVLERTVRVTGRVRPERHADAIRVVTEMAPRDYRIMDATLDRG